MSQADLADACGVSQGMLSKIEAGVAVFPQERLERLAEILGVLPEFFLQGVAVGALGSTCLQFRKRRTLPIKKLREICAIVNIRRIQVERLLKTVEIEEQKFQHLDLEEFSSPEHVAQAMRRLWNVPLGPVANLVQCVEAAGAIVVRLDFQTQQFDAASQWMPGVPPLFFINARMPPDRVRLTLAHEIGHVVMHSIASIDAEAEANRFAAEFLMPASEVRHELDNLTLQRLAELKRIWRVSMQAILYRARELGTLTPRRYRSLMMLMSKLGYRKSEPVTLSAEEPTQLKTIVSFHQREHGYSVDDLAKLMLVPRHRIPDEFMDDGPSLRIVR
jgi:Zn-dependent peptidase ImmA (M78 family)